MLSGTKYPIWETFIQRGDPVEHAFIVESGYARVRRAESNMLVLLKPGDVFGIESLNGRRAKDCIEVKAAVIRKDRAMDAATLGTSWANALGHSLDCLGSRRPDERVARFLLHATSEEQPEMHKITHQDMALFLRTSRENVSDSMGKLRKAGLVDYGRFIVKVKDRAALKEIAYGNV